MTPADHQALVDLLIAREGEKLYAYQDSRGYWTIGVGTLIDRRGGGITRGESMMLLGNRLALAVADLETFPWWADLDPVRQMAVADLRFNLGAAGLRAFKKFLRAMAARQYAAASQALLDSKLLTEEPTRVRANAAMIASGILPARK